MERRRGERGGRRGWPAVALGVGAMIMAAAAIGLLLAGRGGNTPAFAQEDENGDAPAHRSFVPGVIRDGRLPTPTPSPSPTPSPTPDGPQRQVIGHSLQERPIEAVTIGHGTPIVLVGGIHTGIESESVEIVRELRDHFEDNPTERPSGIQLVFIPNVNPDGYASGERLNSRDVDLNRNWPTDDWQPEAIHSSGIVDAGSEPLSEPETRALHDFLLEVEPVFILSYHGYAGVIEDNGVSSNGVEVAYELTRAYARATEYVHIREWTGYPITGQLIDAMEEEGLAAADVELLPVDFFAFERNLDGLRAAMQAALALPGEQ